MSLYLIGLGIWLSVIIPYANFTHWLQPIARHRGWGIYSFVRANDKTEHFVVAIFWPVMLFFGIIWCIWICLNTLFHAFADMIVLGKD